MTGAARGVLRPRGGDTVEVTENALLRINGSLVAEPDIYETTPRYDSDVTYPLTWPTASILSSATPARVRPTAASTAL